MALRHLFLSLALIAVLFWSCDADTTSSQLTTLDLKVDSLRMESDKAKEALDYIKNSANALGGYAKLNQERVAIISKNIDSLIIKTELLISNVDSINIHVEKIETEVVEIGKLVRSDKWDRLVSNLDILLRGLLQQFVLIGGVIALAIGLLLKRPLIKLIKGIESPFIKRTFKALLNFIEYVLKAIVAASATTILLSELAKTVYPPI